MTKMRILVTQSTKINIGQSLFENDVFAKISWNFQPFQFFILYLCPFVLKLASRTHVHTGIVHPCLIQNLALNQKNSLNYISM